MESYARDLILLQEFAAGHDVSVERLTRQQLEELVRQLMSEGRSPRSVARAIACYRGFYRFLTIDKRIKANPSPDIASFRSRMGPVINGFVGKAGAKGKALVEAVQNAGKA